LTAEPSITIFTWKLLNPFLIISPDMSELKEELNLLFNGFINWCWADEFHITCSATMYKVY